MTWVDCVTRAARRLTSLSNTHQFCPRHHRIHRFQKLLTPRLLRGSLELCLMGQRHLPHAAIISLNPKLPVIAVLEKYFQRFLRLQ
jgi:hypothetical protein